MFWNKAKKERQTPSTGTTPPAFPGFTVSPDGIFKLSFDNPAPQSISKVVTDRLYVISRGNIDLEEAQRITIHAAIDHPEQANNLCGEKTVDLIWCSAYPDAIFGEYDLRTLLIGYINRTEGDKYLKKDSLVIPLEGNKDGYAYFIMILIHLEP